MTGQPSSEWAADDDWSQACKFQEWRRKRANVLRICVSDTDGKLSTELMRSEEHTLRRRHEVTVLPINRRTGIDL